MIGPQREQEEQHMVAEQRLAEGEKIGQHIGLARHHLVHAHLPDAEGSIVLFRAAHAAQQLPAAALMTQQD
jgi:hypothetical protein